MKTPIILLTLAAFACSVLAVDVTGTWKAELDTQIGQQKYTFMLKQDGADVTSKANVEVNGENRETELTEGKLDGDTVSFMEPLYFQGNEIRIACKHNNDLIKRPLMVTFAARKNTARFSIRAICCPAARTFAALTGLSPI